MQTVYGGYSNHTPAIFLREGEAILNDRGIQHPIVHAGPAEGIYYDTFRLQPGFVAQLVEDKGTSTVWKVGLPSEFSSSVIVQSLKELVG